MASLEERFWSKVDRRGDDECWLWTGASRPETNHTGLRRGVFRGTFAARVSLEMHMGESIQHGFFALHSCDQPLCVNPAHLYVGTASQNQQERHQRHRTGDIRRKLSERNVRIIHEMFQLRIPGDRIARWFGISVSMVSRLRCGHDWHSIWEEYNHVQTEGLGEAA